MRGQLAGAHARARALEHRAATCSLGAHVHAHWEASAVEAPRAAGSAHRCGRACAVQGSRAARRVRIATRAALARPTAPISAPGLVVLKTKPIITKGVWRVSGHPGPKYRRARRRVASSGGVPCGGPAHSQPRLFSRGRVGRGSQGGSLSEAARCRGKRHLRRPAPGGEAEGWRTPRWACADSNPPGRRARREQPCRKSTTGEASRA